MRKLYIVAHTSEGSDLTIETFYTSWKCVKYVYETTGFHEKPDVGTDPVDYTSRYYDWTWAKENENVENVDIIVKVIDLN